MSEKPVARLGDIGSHGGTIAIVSSSIMVNARPIARVGDIYLCPEHGPNPIISGVKSVFGEGKLVAHVGSKTACGAIITTGSPDTFVDDQRQYINSFAWDILEEKTYIEFQLVDSDSVPIPNEKFKLVLPDNSVVYGKLDSNGFIHVDNVPRGVCSIYFPGLS